MIKSKLKFALLMVSTSLASGAAYAQEASSTGAADVEEIIVTAERRETSLQKSSLAIQVLSPAELEYVNKPQDLTAVSPGVMVGATGANPQVYIRGVGDTAGNTRDTTSVNFSIDGVNLARASGATSSFFDLARVEVLKGPQGTLYGRNASGGAVNVITVRPKLGEVSGFVTGEYGSFNLLSGEGAINLPLGSTVAVRLAGQIVDRDGYMSDGGQDQKTQSLRARVLWEPSDQVSLLLNMDGSHIGGKGSGNSVLPVFTNDPWRSNTQAQTPYTLTSGPAVPTPTDRKVDADFRNISAELNVGLGDIATLTVIPAYRYTYFDTIAYSATQRFAETTTAKQKSLEARLGNNSDTLKWVLGGFYYHENLDQVLVIPTTATAPYNVAVSDQTTESKAVFAQATYSVIPSVRLIGGVRYSSETTSGLVRNGTNLQPVQPATLAGFTITVPGIKVSRTNWKAGVEADIGPSSMFYATASTGFKAGGYSQYTDTCGGKTFKEHDPEDLTAYSAGLRNRFLGGAVQVNMEGFYWKYEGQQVATQQGLACVNSPLNGTTNQRFIVNAGSATIKGANIDVIVRPIKDGALHFFAEYADGEYDSFVISGLPTAGAYLSTRGSRCTVTGAGPVNVDCAGLPLSRLPKWSVAMDYQHTFHLGNGALVRPKVDLQYASSRYADVVYGPNGKLPSYTQLNAQIAYKAPENSWEFTAYVRNITNAKVYTGGLSTTTASNTPATLAGFGAGANSSNIYSVTINPPRQFGVRATKNF